MSNESATKLRKVRVNIKKDVLDKVQNINISLLIEDLIRNMTKNELLLYKEKYPK